MLHILALRAASSATASGASRRRDSKRPTVQLRIAHGSREVVKRTIRDANNVIYNKRRALPGAVLRMLEAALPFKHSPSGEVVLREFAEYRAEIVRRVIISSRRSATLSSIHPTPARTVGVFLDGSF